MGWFWAETSAPESRPRGLPPNHPPIRSSEAPPAECPVRHKTVQAFTPGATCPVDHKTTSACPVPHSKREESGFLAKMNPLNYMFREISQDRAPNQTYALPTSREPSSIPKGSRDGNWEYPSPQQMYNALLRKGYTDTDITAVESMVSVHNFLNEGAWNEIVEWEKRFAGGLFRGARICSWGEENAGEVAELYPSAAEEDPSLVRFQGRPKDMTPKAAILLALGWAWPDKFGTEAPFDRHDWYVSRTRGGQTREIRYVIDYYSGPPEPTGEPVFYLDVRPSFTPLGAAERMFRWAGDFWWRASGGDARYVSRMQQQRESQQSHQDEDVD